MSDQKTSQPEKDKELKNNNNQEITANDPDSRELKPDDLVQEPENQGKEEKTASEPAEAEPKARQPELIPVIEKEEPAEVEPISEQPETIQPVGKVEPSEAEPKSGQPEAIPSVENEKVAEIEPEAEKQPEPIPEAEEKESEKKETEVTAEKSTVLDTADKKEEPDHEEEDEEEDDHDHDILDNKENFDKLTREELINLLEETVKEVDISKIKTRAALIKVAYLKATKEENQVKIEKSINEEGADFAGETDQLEERFSLAFSIYKQNKIAYTQEQEKLKQSNFETKLEILEELKALINSEETLKKTYDEFKALQERWKEVGMVPRTEVNNLWQSYHFLVEKFFDKVKINKELRDLDLKKNFELKIELCEKAEELLIETSIIKSFKELQKLHENWKDIGPVPGDKKDELWDRFKLATDKINERRREHYNNLSEQQNNNFEAKAALCERAEELQTINNETLKEWQQSTNQMNELFKIWRTVGPAPKKKNDEIWNRFKSSLNSFFENKRDYFNKLKEHQLNNYNLKLDLCVQSEAIMDNSDWKKTTDELIRLQKDWKKIGPVPRKHSDKIWKRFRLANDHFFKRKADYFSNIHEHEASNLKLKTELIEKLKKHKFTDDKNENLKLIKDYQREWMEIGHVPMKDKDKIQNSFRAAIDAQLEKLKISALEITTITYKNRVEAMMDDPNARRAIAKERSFLNNKINKMKEDINLWENNIGFLASTKKSELLKEEFNKKIEKSKQDLKIMEAKLNMLNRQ